MRSIVKRSAAVAFAMLMLVGCTEESETKDVKAKKYTFENATTKQQYNIIYTTELVDQYMEQVKQNPDDHDTYKKLVIDPVYSQCFEDGEHVHMMNDYFQHEPDDIATMQVINEKIKDKTTVLNGLIENALTKSSELLSSKSDINVCIMPAKEDSDVMTAVGTGKIFIPYHELLSDDYIKLSVAHEYHHIAWTEKYLTNEAFTVLDNLIFEGKAVMFERTVYPYANVSPIDLTYDQQLWDKIQPDLNKVDFNRTIEIMRGGNGLPEGYGYTEGYKMIKAYLDVHPDTTPETWTALKPEEIVEQGNYFANYQ